MAMRRIIVLSILFTQSLSAPSGCIESCTTTYQKVNSYRTHQVSSNLNDHADLITDSNIRNINHLNLDYNRPGNWTEQNEYRTDGGHGKVYEEQGQYVEGSKRVRYFKKNYTSSYTNTHVNNPDLIQSERLINQNRYNSMHNADSQRVYEQSRNSESYRQEHSYNNLHNDQLVESYRGKESHNGRLENLGGLGDSLQVSQHGMSGGDSGLLQGQNPYIGTRPGNWSQVNTYRTDGGHGRVFEEEGQYVTGPKTIRYYQQNYTSQYSTNPKHEITSNIHDLQNTIQKVNQEFKNLETELHRTSHSKHVASSNTLHTGTMNLIQDNVTPTFKNYDLQVAESADYRHRGQNEYMPAIGTIYNVPQDQLPNRQTQLTVEDALYRNQDNLYNRNRPNIQHQRQETYISQSHTNVLPSPVQSPINENSNYQRYRNNEQIGLQQRENYQREHFDTHQSQMRQNYQSIDSVQQSRLNENIDNYPYSRGQRIQHQQGWDAMGQRSEIVNTNPYDRNQYSSHHRSRTYNMEVVRTVGNNYNPGYTANVQEVATGTHGIDQGMQHEDCTHEMQHSEHRYNRKYKRNADYRRYNHIQEQQQYGRIPKNPEHYQPEKLAYSDYELQHQSSQQQNQDLTQQSEDLTQQTSGFDDLTQQTSGHLEFGQQTQNHGNRNRHNQHIEDLTQQNEDLTQQTGGFDDLTQQTSGHLEFGQQTQNHRYPNSLNQKYEDLTQQTDGFDDLTQQTSGHLEFGQHTQQTQNHRNRSRHSQRIEDLTQQSDDLTQQTGGFDDLTQQTSGHLEFGQQTQNRRNPNSSSQKYEDLTQQDEDLTQQTGRFDDLTQQTSGHLEFGQHTQQTQNQRNRTRHNQHIEDLTQQSDDLTQQTGGFDDLTQQTSGHLEFGQQTQNHGNRNRHNQHIENLTQQDEDLTQQTGGFDDLTQQTSGHLEFGQHTQQTQNHRNRSRHNQRIEDLTQQSDDLTQQTGGFDDLTQQTSGHLEFGQHTQQTQNNRNRSRYNQHIEDLTQQSDDLTQQTGGFDDLTQQTSGHLEFGQQTQDHRNPSSLNQKYEDLTQQTSGNLEFGQQTQQIQNYRNPSRHTEQNDDPTQQTGGFDDLMQHTSGHLEFGQQTQQLQNQRYSTSHNQQFPDEQYFHPSVSGTAEQSDMNENKPLHLLTPAPKPKWKPRYTTSIQFTTDNSKDPNVVHIYHSSDGTGQTISYPNQISDNSRANQEIGKNNELYPIYLQSSNQQEVPKQTNTQTVDEEGNQQHQQQNPHKRITFTKGGHRFRHIYRQSTQNQYQNNYGESQSQLNQDHNPEEVYKRENQNNNQQNEPSQINNSGGKIEPRILEAYGGGPYDANHSDDIFHHVTQNPSVTLPPYSDGIDSWDIREKPREVIPLSMTTTVIPEIPEVPEITEKVETEAPPTFWTRLGHKFTNTFDKAKEKARDIFG
uniref:uncharacterized protein DDB_G0283357-like isoform X9 n=1 Tax=Vespula vulgaris TaxID=7454 RepID=UPI00223BE22C|nr:uncharacterized protein DDB_G0283357-like isoform X9 [Vespula vulgaris]